MNGTNSNSGSCSGGRTMAAAILPKAFLRLAREEALVSSILLFRAQALSDEGPILKLDRNIFRNQVSQILTDHSQCTSIKSRGLFDHKFDELKKLHRLMSRRRVRDLIGAWLFCSMARPPRVPKHKVSGGLRSFNVQ